MAEVQIPEILTKTWGNEAIVALYAFLRDTLLLAPALDEKIRQAVAKEVQMHKEALTPNVEEIVTRTGERLLEDASFHRAISHEMSVGKQADIEAKKNELKAIIASVRETPLEHVPAELVEMLWKAGVLRGRRDSYEANVRTYLARAEAQMAEAINEMLLAKTKERPETKEMVTRYARLLVDKGDTDLNPSAIREALKREDEEADEIIPLIKKS